MELNTLFKELSSDKGPASQGIMRSADNPEKVRHASRCVS